MSITDYSVQGQLFSSIIIIHLDWLELVTWLETSNHNALLEITLELCYYEIYLWHHAQFENNALLPIPCTLLLLSSLLWRMSTMTAVIIHHTCKLFRTSIACLLCCWWLETMFVHYLPTYLRRTRCCTYEMTATRQNIYFLFFAFFARESAHDHDHNVDLRKKTLFALFLDP